VLSFTCLLLSYSRLTYRLLLAILVVGIAGFTAEYIGVHTQLLFGEYHYGNNLGYKLAGIPLLIAINWVMLSFSAIAIVISLQISVLVKALLSATLMTLLDFLLNQLRSIVIFGRGRMVLFRCIIMCVGLSCHLSFIFGY
jgi:putative membrane protein